MNDKPATDANERAFDPAAHGWEIMLQISANLVGPIWRAKGRRSRLRFGFVVAPKHLNRAGNLHGGMLMTFADQAMGDDRRGGDRRQASRHHRTQYPVRRRVQPRRIRRGALRGGAQTRSVCSCESKLLCRRARIVVTANGIWKILGEA
jgi:hypothetical protein